VDDDSNFSLNFLNDHARRKILSLGGERTPVSRVAGENSTTEPPTQQTEKRFLRNFYYFAVDLNTTKFL
jgi:hypothetical protein